MCVCANTMTHNIFAYKDFDWIPPFRGYFNWWQRHPPAISVNGSFQSLGPSCVSRLPKKQPHWVSLSLYCYFSAISLSSVWEAFQIIQTRFWWYDFVGAEQATAELCRFGEDSAGAQCSFCLLSTGQSLILSGRCAFALLRHVIQQLQSILFASEKKYNTNFTIPSWTKANKLKCSNECSVFCKWISNLFRLSTGDIWDWVSFLTLFVAKLRLRNN